MHFLTLPFPKFCTTLYVSLPFLAYNFLILSYRTHLFLTYSFLPLSYISLPFLAFPYITSHFPSFHYLTFLFLTLPPIFFSSITLPFLFSHYLPFSYISIASPFRSLHYFTDDSVWSLTVFLKLTWCRLMIGCRSPTSGTCAWPLWSITSEWPLVECTSTLISRRKTKQRWE